MKIKLTGFWNDESCEYCGGSISEKKVEVTKKVHGQYALFKNVPAGVCTECGTRYYSANVLKEMDKSRAEMKKPKKLLKVPVFLI